MDCPMCGTQTYVINSRTQTDFTQRRRLCKECGHRFNTIEIDMDLYNRLQSVKPVNKAAIHRAVMEATDAAAEHQKNTLMYALKKALEI